MSATTPHTEPSRGEERQPTGLKPVLRVIPSSCYERSTARGLFLFGRDLIMYFLIIAGLLSTDNWLLLFPLWALSGIVVASLFVIGHDAAHKALFDSRRLNAVVARVAMLPSLHATELWIFGHNRVHHGHTLREGFDFVWHPVTAEQYRSMSRLARARHRFEWGPFGAGAYYVREVWWNKMVRYLPHNRWRKPMRRDKLLVTSFLVTTLAVLLLISGTSGICLWVKVVILPFVLFCQTIGWVVYVHHIAPDIRWWSRHEWNRFHGQMEGTTILNGPPGWDFFFHWIMVHVPHHVDMSIPCYHLPEAARAISAAFPETVKEQPIRLRDYLASVRQCKVHDFDTGTWATYPPT